MRMLALLLLFFALPASAQDMVTIGTARLFTNDVIDGGRDRWRTASYQHSWLRAPAGMDPAAPEGFLEYRFRSDMFSPWRGGLDRPWAGALSFGLHAHTRQGPWEGAVGLDVTFVGPSTGLSRLQTGLHDVLGLPAPVGHDTQLPDAVYPGAVAEVAYRWSATPGLTVRPFAEALAGPEDLVRAGVDVIAGGTGHDATFVRDVGTGTLLPGAGLGAGWALLGGADWARVAGSVYLPADRGVTPLAERWRARMGVIRQTAHGATLFAGVTWLSPEFAGQPEGQWQGSLRVDFRF